MTDQQVEGKISAILRYEKKVTLVTKKMLPTEGWLFHRRDFHEDGSVSETWGVEMTKEDYERLKA